MSKLVESSSPLGAPSSTRLMPALMPAPTLTQRVSSISIVPAPCAETAQSAPSDPTRGAALVRDDAIRFSFFVHVLPPVFPRSLLAKRSSRRVARRQPLDAANQQAPCHAGNSLHQKHFGLDERVACAIGVHAGARIALRWCLRTDGSEIDARHGRASTASAFLGGEGKGARAPSRRDRRSGSRPFAGSRA